ncbi:MAG: hypothetical protein EBT92_06745 [Planctomycetes bacterium]|nr:hypothetical protein [Planctomycetota bacterium]
MQELDLAWFLALLVNPLIFAVICGISSFRSNQITPWIATLGGALSLGISLGMAVQFKYDTVEQLGVLDDENTRLQTSLFERGKVFDLAPGFEVHKSFDWVTRVRWVPKLGINFILGLDGLNLAIIILVALIYFLSLLSSWLRISTQNNFYPLIFVSQFGLFGVLLSFDGVFVLIFLAISILTYYFMIQNWGGESKSNSAYIFGTTNTIGLLILAGVLSYCYKSDLTKFANQGEIEIAKKQLERAHPDWSEKQLTEFLSYHSFNILTFQRAGLENLAQSKTSTEKNTKQKHVFFILTVLAAALLLGFSSPVMALAYKTYQNTDISVAMLLAGAFPILGIYIFTRFGMQIFPSGIVLSAYWLTWITIGILIALNLFFLFIRSPERFIVLISCWLQLICYLGILTSFAGLPNAWKAKNFAGSFIWVLGGYLCISGLVYLWKQIKCQVLVDIIDFKIGTLKKAPLIGCSFSILLIALVGCPGFINSLGMFLLAGSALQFGFIPALLTGISFIFIVISCYRILNIILGDSTVTPPLSDLKLQQTIVVFATIIPIITLGLFPNIMLSWYMPSTSAISELIQTTLVK